MVFFLGISCRGENWENFRVGVRFGSYVLGMLWWEREMGVRVVCAEATTKHNETTTDLVVRRDA